MNRLWLNPPPVRSGILMAVLMLLMLTVAVAAIYAGKRGLERDEESRIIADLRPRPWVLGLVRDHNHIIDFAESYDECMVKKERFISRVPDKQKVRYMVYVECRFDPEKWKQRNLP